MVLPGVRIASVRRSRVHASSAVAVIVVGLLVASACSSDDDDDGTATSTTRASTSTSSDDERPPTTTAPSTTTATATAPCPPLDGATTDATAERSDDGDAACSRNVDLATGDCTDSVAFTFDVTGADAPGYRVEYVPGPITQDGSGEPVTVAGSAYLSVRFEPAYGYDFDTGEATYTGPDRVSSPGALLREGGRADRRLRGGPELGHRRRPAAAVHGHDHRERVDTHRHDRDALTAPDAATFSGSRG